MGDIIQDTGAFFGFGESTQSESTRKSANNRTQQAVNLASPASIIDAAAQFRQSFGAQFAPMGRAMESSAATQNARRGITGSGLGIATRNAAAGAPELLAQQAALNSAFQSRGAQSGAAISGPFAPTHTSGGNIGNALGLLANFGLLGGGGNKTTGGQVPPVSGGNPNPLFPAGLQFRPIS